jgi:hypothetical protein
MCRAGIVLAIAVAGCDSDDTQEGARADCAEGGAINACPDSPETPEAAIPLRSSDDNQFDWGNCVDDIAGLTEDRQLLVEQCVAASTCDELKVDGSPDHPNAGEEPCFQIGAQ